MLKRVYNGKKYSTLILISIVKLPQSLINTTLSNDYCRFYQKHTSYIFYLYLLWLMDFSYVEKQRHICICIFWCCTFCSLFVEILTLKQFIKHYHFMNVDFKRIKLQEVKKFRTCHLLN
jgi:hypothetical protein